MPHNNEIIAIETPVTDYIYDEASANIPLRNAFLKFLKPECPPRKGDNIMFSVQDWEGKLLTFAKENSLEEQADAQAIHQIIFGAPRAVEAGGAVANSFATLTEATLNDKKVATGSFVTAIGEGLSGEVFAKSLGDKLVAPSPCGRQLEAHIFPIDGDRIIITMPDFVNPCERHMCASHLDAIEINEATRMMILGGYVHYTGKYETFLHALLTKAEKVSHDPLKRPIFVFTTAAQDVAASPSVRNALEKTKAIAPVIICANTGEFRRLMRMDTIWRHPHEAKWWVNKEGMSLFLSDDYDAYDPNSPQGIKKLLADGWRRLEGHDLETAKQADAFYKQDKLTANQVAYQNAFRTFCQRGNPVTFVVTNGKNGVYVVDHNGISNCYVPPRPPHGVVNTVGGGDGFAAGYLMGHLKNLPQHHRIELGFICAGEVIGQDPARLAPRSTAFTHDLAGHKASGLPAYLDQSNDRHKRILHALLAQSL